MKHIILLSLLIICLNSYAQFSPDTAINKFASEWINRPYKFGGGTKAGIDCSNLTKTFYKDTYGIDIGRVAIEQWNRSKRIPENELKPGDLVFFSSKTSPSGWHVGIYIGDNKFLHASNRNEGVKISPLKTGIYKTMYKGAGRFNHL